MIVALRVEVGHARHVVDGIEETIPSPHLLAGCRDRMRRWGCIFSNGGGSATVCEAPVSQCTYMTGKLETVSDLPGVRSKFIHGRRESHVRLGVGLCCNGAWPQVGRRLLGDGTGHPGGNAIVGQREGVTSKMMVKRDPLAGVSSIQTFIWLGRKSIGAMEPLTTSTVSLRAELLRVAA